MGKMSKKVHSYDKVVFLLQGGGALGSYQLGVCKALFEFGIQPDWLVGTSIGAINSAIIAGNEPENRFDKLKAFWDSISIYLPEIPLVTEHVILEELVNLFSANMISTVGVKGFFRPRLFYPWLYSATTPDNISFYTTDELRDTLCKFVDFDLLNRKKTRITLGSVNVATGDPVLFDNFECEIKPEHIMASGAIPPAFPAIKIDDNYYWDGGISTNTPLAAVMKKKVPQKLLCFIVNLFSYHKHIPDTMMNVLNTKKDIEFASKHKEIIKIFSEMHFLQNTIESLSNMIPNNATANHIHTLLKQIGHPTALNIVRFHYQDQPSDLWSKDYNFSKIAINKHYEKGVNDAARALKNPTWLEVIDDEAGAVLHEF